MCQNVQTTIGGGKSERPNFLHPYLPNGGGGGGGGVWEISKFFFFFFFMAPLIEISHRYLIDMYLIFLRLFKICYYGLRGAIKKKKNETLDIVQTSAEPPR